MSAGLRGKKLDEFIEQWIEQRLDAKQKKLYSGFISNRFKKGPLALPLEILEKLDQGKNTIFPNETAMKEWLEAQGWPDAIKQQIIAAVPPTKRVADDALVCLDLASGKTLWKACRLARRWAGMRRRPRVLRRKSFRSRQHPDLVCRCGKWADGRETALKKKRTTASSQWQSTG